MKAHMICHTHWDREWYFTREEFRTKLVRLIDGLLEMVEEVPEYVSFMLDGQTIAIEDYLEIKPYNREKLYGALRSGKIICGPWYVLPDELLISGESHIRNYLVGGRILNDAGRKMKIGYLPDSFGHPAQMPQIVKGLGMDAMVFWRGTPDFLEKTEFYWISPARGISCLCIHMPCGYGNCGNLSGTEDEILDRVKSMVETLGSRSTTDVVLLMNGSDHITGQKNIVNIVKNVNARSEGEFQVELSTLESYLAEVKETLTELSSYEGEFRYGHRSMLLGGTLSTRMYLKQENNRVQRGMEQYLEPVLACEYLLGGSNDNKGYLQYIWKKILENHPHDSICGCSIDEVHREMEARFACVGQLEKKLFEDAMGRIGVMMTGEGEEEEVILLLFEPSQDCQPSYLEMTVDMDKMLVQEVDFSKSIIVDYEEDIKHPNLPEKITVTADDGSKLLCHVLSAEKSYTTKYQDHTMPEVYKTNRVKIGVLLPGQTFGLHTLKVACDGRSREQVECLKPCGAVRDRKIKNEYYMVSFENGAFTVLDKKSGKTHLGVNRFIDKGDAGDEYTYSWPKEDRVFGLEECETRLEIGRVDGIRECMTVSGNLRLPVSLDEDRKRRSDDTVLCPVEITVSLTAGIDRIDFATKIDNRTKDHRIQVRFPSGIHTDYTEAGDIFHVTRRPIEVVVPKNWAEYPQSTHPLHGFMNLEDGCGGVAVSAQGLTEYEGVQEPGETCLNLTLLRCVGWLSRTDLITREGNGGWTIETPEAQCIGTYEFRYNLTYHDGNWKNNGVYQILDKALKPSVVQQIEGVLMKEQSVQGFGFLSELPPNVRLSAFKPSEDGEGLVFRMYNIGSGEERFELRLPDGVGRAYAVNLAEKNPEELPIEDGKISLCIWPNQIETVKMDAGLD